MKLYLNTALMIFFRVVCAVAFSSMAGYAFAMLNFRGKNLLFGIVLVQMSLPSQIFIIPQYQMVAHTGLANTIFALVFPGIVSAFGVFFLRQTYMGIPKEVGESAYLDGCNQWQTFYKVMFPPTWNSPGVATSGAVSIGPARGRLHPMPNFSPEAGCGFVPYFFSLPLASRWKIPYNHCKTTLYRGYPYDRARSS